MKHNCDGLHEWIIFLAASNKAQKYYNKIGFILITKLKTADWIRVGRYLLCSCVEINIFICYHSIHLCIINATWYYVAAT